MTLLNILKEGLFINGHLFKIITYTIIYITTIKSFYITKFKTNHRNIMLIN